MQDLRLVAAIDNGLKLLLRSTDGSEYTLPIDEKLKAALRGDRVRLGQIEIETDAPLRPRDIQARIRAGASAEQVASAAGIPLERVRRYEGPVLAEREHMAGMARRTAIRGPMLTDGPAPLLGDIVGRRLRESNVEPDTASWDSWRREDGRWQIAVVYRPPASRTESDDDAAADVRPIRAGAAGDGPERALFAFDPGRRTVMADDDNARALIADPRAWTAEAVVALIPHVTGQPADIPGADADPVTGDLAEPPDGAAPPRVGVPSMGGLVPLAPVPPRRPDRPNARTDGRRGPARSRRPHVPASATAPIRRPSAYDERFLGTADRSTTRDSIRASKRATVPPWDEIVFGARSRTPE